MGARFLACAWDPTPGAPPERLQSVQGDLAAAFGGPAAYIGPGMAVWSRAGIALPVRPLANGGVLIGRLCGGPSPPPGPAAVMARSLIAQGWGTYVAVLAGEGAHPWWALRDPSGAMDALTWRMEGLRLLADDLEGVPPRLWPARLALDWRAIGRIVRSPLAAAGGSALADLVAVAPGDLQPFGGEAREAVALWRPAWVAARSCPADPETRLRAVISETVDALGAAHGPLVVETSGGLDSSIVARSLARGPARDRARIAFNQYAAERDSDERAYARRVCDLAGLRLRAQAKPIARIEPSDLTALAGGVRPPVSALDLIRDRVLIDLAREVGAAAVMTGQGGDAVFFQMPAAHVVADLWRDRGPGPAFLTGLTETAQWLRRSVWSVLAEAGRPRNPADLAPLRPFWGPAVRFADGPTRSRVSAPPRRVRISAPPPTGPAPTSSAPGGAAQDRVGPVPE